MEKEKLIIRNFGPIKDVELDLGRFNILIGEQATGKSTVAKVLAVCRYFSYIVGKKGIIDEQKGVFYSMVAMDIPFIDGLEDWGINGNLKSNSYISYSCKDYQIVFDRLRANDFAVVEIIPLSDNFLNLLLELKGLTQDFYQRQANTSNQKQSDRSIAVPISNIPYNFYKTNVANVMNNPFYLPAERGLQSIFSLGKSSIGNIADSLFSQFAQLDETSRNFPNETNIEPLNIFYENRNGHGFIRKADENEYYSLYNAASGYQSTIPLVLTIKYYNEIKKKNKTFLIEEPELNLFPSAQNKLMQYIVQQTIAFNNSVLLTTQSPYILTSVNNLMYAYQLGQQHPQEVSKEIDKKYWLNPDDVSAYMMLSNGGYEDIFDREEGLIKAEKIDGVSSEINKTFSELLNIEFKENELDT